MGTVLISQQLDLMTLAVFSNLNDCMIPYGRKKEQIGSDKACRKTLTERLQGSRL